MVTALAATLTPAVGLTPPSVLLAVTGAPSAPLPVYTSNFATVDGWAGAGTNPATVSVAAGALTVKKTISTKGTAYTASRTITGLTNLTRYRLRVKVRAGGTGQIRISIDPAVGGVWTEFPADGFLDYYFVSSGTSQVVWVAVQTLSLTADPSFVITQATVTPAPTTWGGTVITRTDANGTALVVREDLEGNDTVAGAMTIRDYEAALVGAVQYTVTDGNGGVANAPLITATAQTNAGHGSWLTLPATARPGVPAAPTARPLFVLDFDESSESRGTLHEIVGRWDPIDNPGPLGSRAGALECFCQTYAEAKAIRTALAAGDVGLIRQPDFPGLDLYFTADAVRIVKEDLDSATRRWAATIAYTEVAAP